MPLPRPSAVSIHDYGDVFGETLRIEAGLQFLQGSFGRLLTVLTEGGSHANAFDYNACAMVASLAAAMTLFACVLEAYEVYLRALAVSKR